MVNDGHTQRVEGHEAKHCPVERVCLHHAADGDAQETLLSPEIGCGTPFGTPDACSGHGDALGEMGEVERNSTCTTCSHCES